MQVYAINGSPRPKWNTSTLLQSVLDGAAEAADNVLTETINLYSLKYKGCISCMQCKLVGGPSYGKCAVKDEIYELLQNASNADVLVFGSPIYFSDITGMTRCFLERLLFPYFVYDQRHSSIAPRKLRSAFVYTMNVTAEAMKEYHYSERLKPMEGFVGHIFGHAPHILYANNTLQVKDYAKYDITCFSEAEKLKYREEVFPLDLAKAKELGAKLGAEATGD
ncbi:MAG: flavodoxin family protein [Desulfovibrio sp.]|nr:flavodoxin family protein [Desulfovibrio sp.]